jgi:RNA polymerase sigma factor (sigma-70 family)
MQVSFLTVARSPEPELLIQAQRYLSSRASNALPDQNLESAWIEFYRHYSYKIRKFAFSCGAREEDVADCIQDAWAELLIRMRTFRLDPNRGSFDSWVYQIVRTKTVDLFRSKRKWDALLADWDHMQKLATDHPNPARIMEEKELFAFVWEELRKRLSTSTLRVLQMRLLEERSVAEVAKELGFSHEQVWYRYHRARRQAQQIAKHNE